MRSLLMTIVISAASTALALGLSAWLFEGFSVTWPWLIVAVVLYAALFAALRAAAVRLGSRWLRVYAITGGLALTLVALWLTDLVVAGPGFELDGAVAWVGCTTIVWALNIAFGDVDSHAPADTPGRSLVQ